MPDALKEALDHLAEAYEQIKADRVSGRTELLF